MIVQDNPVVPGVDEWLDKQNPGVREALLALGALLSGRDYESGRKPPRQDAWIAEQLGVDNLTKVARVHRAVGAVDTVRVGMALAAMVTDPGTVCGPRAWSSSDLDDAVEWITAEIMSGHTYTYPAEIALATNTLGDDPVVVIWRAKDRIPSLQVAAGDHAIATAAAQQLVDCARRDHDPFRGGVWRLGGGSYQQLELHARPRPTMRRGDVALAAPAWAELDLAAAAVTSAADRMRDLGLGCRRGVLLAGPPGTGKSAAAEVIAAELAGACTVVYVDGRAAAYSMEAITSELVLLGGPVLLVIEDLDLAVGGPRGSRIDHVLGQFLAGMDAHRDEPILVIATTNTLDRIDPAAVRSARFDATIEIGYPDAGERERILAALCVRVPGSVDVAAVAAAAPATATGADMREWVRRCVLAEGEVSTSGLVAAAGGTPVTEFECAGAYL